MDDVFLVDGTTMAPQEFLQNYLEKMVSLRRQIFETNRCHDWPYLCMEDFVLRHGQVCQFVDYPARWKTGYPRCCFQNAYTLARRKSLLYVEGFALAVIPVHHAWCIRPGSVEVIDPTWHDMPGLAYLGVSFNLDLVADTRKREVTVLEDWNAHFPLLSGKLTESQWRP